MNDDDFNAQLQQAAWFAQRLGYVSVASIQAHLRTGYLHSAKLAESLVARGVVGPMDASGRWPFIRSLKLHTPRAEPEKPAIPAPQPCGHDARYIWPPDASDPDDEHQPTRYCLKCAFDALGDAMTASLRDANDLRNALNISGGREVDLQAEVRDLRGELTHLRTEREREPGNDMLKVLHACSVSAYNEAKAERATYGDKMTSRVGELEAEIVKLREALKPFSKYAAWFYPPHGYQCPDDMETTTLNPDNSSITAGEWRKARELTTPKENSTSNAEDC